MKRFVISLLLSTHMFFHTAYAIEVQGHRGARGVCPENCLPSFNIAMEAGVDAVELDVLATQDGQLVIHHNYFLNKELCCYLNGDAIDQETLILNLPLSKIKELDCGSKRNEKFPAQVLVPGTQIPTLGELFAMLDASNHPRAKVMRINIEIKRRKENPEYTLSPAELVEKVLSVVKQHNFESRVYYSSFDRDVLLQLRKLDPNAEIGFLAFTSIVDILQGAALLNPQIVSPDHLLLQSAQDVQLLKNAGYRVIPYTVNDEARWRELISFGVDGIITDYPAKLLRMLSAKN